MSRFANRASDDLEQVQSYISGLLETLGPRDPIEVMHETPEKLRRALTGVPPAQLSAPEAPGKWSMRQVMQHLADSELVGGFRFRMVLAHDRPALQGYDQDLWAERLRYAEADVGTTLSDFTTLRYGNLRVLQHATAAERQRCGIHAERGEESLERLMQLYAAHDLVHLRQLARIRTAVGAGAGSIP